MHSTILLSVALVLGISVAPCSAMLQPIDPFATLEPEHSEASGGGASHGGTVDLAESPYGNDAVGVEDDLGCGYEVQPSPPQGESSGNSTGGAQAPEQEMAVVRIIGDINQGRSISGEEAAFLARDPGFLPYVQQNPQLAAAIAAHPYAANRFYEQAEFKTWSETYPEQAQQIVDSAAQWRRMSREEKQEFIQQHPGLQPY